ncbi:MAG: helix-turn-helix transcriptional regulator [Ferruginibacter sp.]
MTIQPDLKLFADALQISHNSYRNIERGERELSFLMTLRICRFYHLDLHEFISMISDEELNRADLSVIKAKGKIERKKAEASKAKIIDIKTEALVPGASR